jgi:small subunit ribosomal protein S21
MAEVRIKEGESFERAMKRFRRAVDRAGIRKECRRRMFYVKPSEQRRIKRRQAERRRRKALRRQRMREMGN